MTNCTDLRFDGQRDEPTDADWQEYAAWRAEVDAQDPVPEQCKDNGRRACDRCGDEMRTVQGVPYCPTCDALVRIAG